MKSTLRRLSAAAGAATAVAVVASVLVAPSASAAALDITPNTAFNTEAAKALAFDFEGNTQSDGDYRLGGTATFTRIPTASSALAATFTVSLSPTPSMDGREATATEDFTDEGGDGANTQDGVGLDGPADAGTYNVTAQDRAMNATDGCLSCFTVFAAGQVEVASVSNNSLQSGSAATEFGVTGNNFERSSKIEMLFPGTDTVDTNISPNGAIADDRTTLEDERDGVTTRTELRRTVTVGNAATTGARDVRVTNLDGNSARLSRAFSVNGAPLSSTTPTGGVNDPAPAAGGAVQPSGLTRVTFNGSGLSSTGVPVLQYVADPGSSTREALTITGAVVSRSATAIVGDFDLRNAAPAAYQPVVRNTDGSFNSSSRRFTVAQAPGRTTTVTGLDSDPSATVTDSSQAANSTETFTVTGTNFAKGTRVTVAGAGVTTTAVQFVSPTQLRATFQTTANAAQGDRAVTVARTDAPGATGSTGSCGGCYAVTPAASPGPSPSATATSTVSPRPSTSPSPSGVEKPTVGVFPSTIVAVEEKATVSGTSTPGATVEIHAYSRPSTKYVRVRSRVVGADGTYSFNDIGPSGNTRLFARTVTARGFADSPSTVLTVRTSLNLNVTRTGPRTYRFTGSLLPKRPGQLITVFYVNGSGRTIAARARNAANGTYNVTRRFSGTGTFTFFTGTGTDNNNAANNSNRVRVTIR